MNCVTVANRCNHTQMCAFRELHPPEPICCSAGVIVCRNGGLLFCDKQIVYADALLATIVIQTNSFFVVGVPLREN